MDNKIFIGDKFYKENEHGEIDIIRIVKRKNENLYMAKNSSHEDKFRVTLSDLQENYTKLIPDGYITASIVSLENNIKDVIVTLHRAKDIENGNNNPYAVCRQSIFDIFANQLTKGDVSYVGCSVSVDTCPEDLDMNIFLACNGIDYSSQVSIYIDDDEQVYDLIEKKTKCNYILEDLHNKMKDIFDNNGTKILGYCKTLKELLTCNDFMFDFNKAFDVIKTDFSLNYSYSDDYILDQNDKIRLEDIIKYKMINPICIKYNYDIDLDKIKKDYILIKDKDSNLFVISYDKGEYINRPYISQNPDKKELLTLSKYSPKTFQ